MKYRWFLAVAALAVIGGLLWPVATTRVSPDKKPATWTLPRTAWGHPDLQGIWDSRSITPMERPAEYAGRTFLTDDEVAALEGKAESSIEGAIESGAGASRDGSPREPGTTKDVARAYSLAFSSFSTKYLRSKRTSLIVDPEDGKIPYSAKGREKLAAEVAFRKALSASDLRPVVDQANGPEERTNDRCTGFVPPCTNMQCGFARFVQSPEAVTIYYEGGHVGGVYRTIALDGRPHLPPNFRQWYGDSIGHWEGDTLVVDVTNFSSWKGGNLITAQLGFRGNGEGFHLVERFTRVAPDMILYRVVFENPELYTKPWTIEMQWIQADSKKNQIYESACHEGNYGLTNTLSGARADERELARRSK